MTLTLLGDVFLGIFLTMVADRVGRRRILFAGSGLMIFSGLIFSYFENFWILLLAAILGESWSRDHDRSISAECYAKAMQAWSVRQEGTSVLSELSRSMVIPIRSVTFHSN